MLIIAIIITIIIMIIHVIPLRTIRDGGIPSRESARTYLVYGSLGGLSKSRLDLVAARYGFRERIRPKRAPEEYWVTLVWSSQVDTQFDPQSFLIPCRVKNLLDVVSYRAISEKHRLHENMALYARNIYEQFFARTWHLDEFKTVPEGNVYITRPSGLSFFGGRGIYRVANNAELARVRAEYARAGTRGITFIISEYLNRPYLYDYGDGRVVKFHLRMYFLISYVHGRAPEVLSDLFGAREFLAPGTTARDCSGMPPRAKILTAKKPYVRANYDDMEIHDTHAKSTTGALYFPTHVDAIRDADGHPLADPWQFAREVYSQMNKVCAAMVDILKKFNGPRPYEESYNAFDVFGLDVLISDDGAHEMRVKLLELNDRVGYTTPDSPLFIELQDEYFDWAMRLGVMPAI